MILSGTYCIPHKCLILMIKSLIEEAFQVKEALYISITRRGKLFWVPKVNTIKYSIDPVPKHGRILD